MPKSEPRSRPAKPPLCASAPVLWSLVPLILGILSIHSGRFIVIACPAILIVTAIRMTVGKKTVLIFSYTLGALLQWTTSIQPHPLWELLPKREVTMLIKVEEIYNTRKPGRTSGIGKILQTNIPHDSVSGRRTSYYLKTEHEDSSPILRGQVILCKGVLSYLPSIDDHDGFQEYLIGRDIFTTFNQGHIITSTQDAPIVERIRIRHFEHFQNALRSGRDRPDSPGNVLGSMLLGDRRLLRDEQIDLYRKSGTYHLFAVSGLHVGCVALFIGSITRFIRISSKWAALPVILATWYYVWLTGSSPSATRAGIMISCLVCSRMLLRQPHLFPALAFSAWLVLILFPEQLFNLGFQLSYSVVGSIILTGLPASAEICNRIRSRAEELVLHAKWRHILLRISTSAVDLGCISLSAGVVSMPLIMEHFQLFTPGGVLIGIILNPLATIVIMLGCLSMTMATLSVYLSGWIAMMTWPIIHCIEWILGIGIQVPGAYSTRTWIVPHSGTSLVLLSLATAWVCQYFRQHNARISSATMLVPILLVLAGLHFGSLDA